VLGRKIVPWKSKVGNAITISFPCNLDLAIAGKAQRVARDKKLYNGIKYSSSKLRLFNVENIRLLE
jgi:hypothetical protein